MAIKYNKLFKLLIDKNIKKGELQEMADISSSIMSRLGRNLTVRTDTIDKICTALNCQPEDIMEYEPDKPKSSMLKQLKESWQAGIDFNKNKTEEEFEEFKNKSLKEKFKDTKEAGLRETKKIHGIEENQKKFDKE